MYKIVLPILGFEGFNSLSIEKIDESFSFLVLDEKTKIWDAVLDSFRPAYKR